MRVFLTGATGFIGSHLARLLVREGYEVHALIRQASNMWRIKDIVPSLKIVPCDLLASEELGAHLTRIRPDLCLHLAWYAEPGKYLESPENIVLLSASLHLASRLASLGCKKFIAAGTCLEYDINLGYLSETSSTNPQSLYAVTKLALQLVLVQLARTTGMEATWLRFFYQYGPFEDARRLVPSVICSLLRNQVAKVTFGEQVRDFLHVEDVATAVLAVALSNLSGPVNIGSGKPVTVCEIVTTLSTILKRPELIALGALPYSSSDPMFICANNRRLRENTNWDPQFDLEPGLRHTIEWWRTRLETI